ncbi:hypothetical protein BGX23_009419, partial [Mortierella sp. AD031]
MDAKKHPVIDALDKTRQDHHEEPFPNPHPHPHPTSAGHQPLSQVGKDVVDEILEQSEAVHIPSTSTPASAEAPTLTTSAAAGGAGGDRGESKDHLAGLSTTATLPSTTWQPLASMSSNQLPSSTIVSSIHGHGHGDRHYEVEHHDKPSVLPEILPGFKDRLADIHHATLKSVSDVTPSSSHGATGSGGNADGAGEAAGGAQWTGGTMFPAMTTNTTGFKNPFDDGRGRLASQHQQQHHRRSSSEDANHKIARSSILYESSDLTESTSKLTDDDDHDSNNVTYHHTTTNIPASTTTGGGGGSRTLVQGGQGGRRWSHELSPEKAGLVGS